MAGTRLTLTGKVLSTDCQPIEDAVLDFWQADSEGAYDNVGFRLRGRLAVGADGGYTLDTILPGLYPGRPAHIHVKVTAPDGRSLTTQVYFFGDDLGGAEALVDPTRLAPVESSPDGGLIGRIDFVLEPLR